MTLTADPPSSNFGAIWLDAFPPSPRLPTSLKLRWTGRRTGPPAILLSSPGFRLYLITSRQVAAAGDRAGSNLIKVNQTQSNQCAPASRPLPKETYKADLDDPLRKGIQS